MRRRLTRDLSWRANLLDPALVENGDAVGEFHCFALVVGDERRRQRGPVMNFPEPLAQVLAHLGVQRAKWFVEQRHAWFDSHRARQGDALAGVRVRKSRGVK